MALPAMNQMGQPMSPLERIRQALGGAAPPNPLHEQFPAAGGVSPIAEMLAGIRAHGPAGGPLGGPVTSPVVGPDQPIVPHEPGIHWFGPGGSGVAHPQPSPASESRASLVEALRHVLGSGLPGERQVEQVGRGFENPWQVMEQVGHGFLNPRQVVGQVGHRAFENRAPQGARGTRYQEPVRRMGLAHAAGGLGHRLPIQFR